VLDGNFSNWDWSFPPHCERKDPENDGEAQKLTAEQIHTLEKKIFRSKIRDAYRARKT
jgi:hypothetical protein